jgi:hypothetical protein
MEARKMKIKLLQDYKEHAAGAILDVPFYTWASFIAQDIQFEAVDEPVAFVREPIIEVGVPTVTCTAPADDEDPFNANDEPAHPAAVIPDFVVKAAAASSKPPTATAPAKTKNKKRRR